MQAPNILWPVQVDVGVPMGCHAIVHAMRCIQGDTIILLGSKLSLLLDLSNTFNCINFTGKFKKARAKSALMAGWDASCVLQSSLHLSGHTIYSC